MTCVPNVRDEIGLLVATPFTSETLGGCWRSAPSTRKRTVPVGVPPPGAVAATVAVNVTPCATTDGFTDDDNVVVVAAAFTVCAAPAEALVRKFASPAYVAVSVFAPAVVNVRLHVPAATVPVHVVPAPSLTVTFPVGVPAPGAVTATA